MYTCLNTKSKLTFCEKCVEMYKIEVSIIIIFKNSIF